jgi:dihydrofolate synthase/folylpolyglutamate synthase
MTTYEQALEYLYGRINYERVQSGSYTHGDFKLDRVRELLRRLGNPEDRIPAVHIAGTKGKGTTSAMVASILEQAGYRVGLFTSPHISHFEERIKVNGQMPSREEIARLVRQVALASEAMDQMPGQMAPTFFELTMALGWLWFEAQNVDLAVLEVGLGGRFDATNVCRPLVSAITSISRDHTGLLGSTLRQIAQEKAGIVKPGVPVLTGVEDPSALEAIEAICRTESAPLLTLGKDIRFEAAARPNRFQANSLWVETPFSRHEDLRVPLTGTHQFRNAALAVGIVDVLRQKGYPVDEACLREGLARTQWPLRIEVVGQRPLVVLDVAHNWASIKALLETIEREFSAPRRILIFAASRDKDVTGMLRQLIARFDTLIVTQFLGNPRSVGLAKLSALVRNLSGRMAHAASSPAQAWNLARRLAGPDDLICGTGSFFIASELREVLVEPPRPLEPLEASNVNLA